MLVDNVPGADVDAKNSYKLTALTEMGVPAIPGATDANSELIRMTLGFMSARVAQGKTTFDCETKLEICEGGGNLAYLDRHMVRLSKPF